MNRWTCFATWVLAGAAVFVCAWLMPVHLRAVNTSVIEWSGKNTTTLVERGLLLAGQNNVGAVRFLFQTAQAKSIHGYESLGVVFDKLQKQELDLANAGASVNHILWELNRSNSPSVPGEHFTRPSPFTEVVLGHEGRENCLDLLRKSPQPGVQELLRSLALTNTAIFPPSRSSAGQAFDAAICVCGLLLEQRAFTDGLSNNVVAAAVTANRGGNSEPLEQALLDLMSLGQRFDWGQLVAFVGTIEDADVLRRLAGLARNAEGQLPVLFSAVQLSGKPAALASYLTRFRQTGLRDVANSLRFGMGGLNELLRRNQQLQPPTSLDNAAKKLLPGGAQAVTSFCWRKSSAALTVKWFGFLLAGLFLGQAIHVAWPAASSLEKPLHVRGFHWARQILFALGFLLVVLLLSEPFLSQDSQKVEFPFRVRLSTGDSAIPARSASVKPNIMNQLSLLTLLLFFVLQALIYLACLLKLAEIRRQKIVPRLKLKLLENEDHLFDAGLYLGFVGTIISLILVSLGVIKPSLMAAYSSTSFGIIFVSIFKIFHLRPVRRQLLLEAEANPSESIESSSGHPLPAPL